MEYEENVLLINSLDVENNEITEGLFIWTATACGISLSADALVIRGCKFNS